MGSLPRSTSRTVNFLQKLKVLLISNSENNLTKRVKLELQQRKVDVNVVEAKCSQTMEEAVARHHPDVIVCPFLTKRVPSSITADQTRPCLIVHPGIAGDRGPSSLDWAIRDSLPEWGATVLQAEEEMDAGAIWCTDNFKMDSKATKASVYVGDVSDSAVKCVMESLNRFVEKKSPVPLSYDDPEVKGCERRQIKAKDRKIDWNMSAEECSAIIRMSDTQPGGIIQLPVSKEEFVQLRAFDAYVESGAFSTEMKTLIQQHKPGDVIGKKNGAILVKTGDDKAIWIGQLKQNSKSFNGIKLPAFSVMNAANLGEIGFPAQCDDIRVSIRNGIAYVHFDFYNGAMDKHQAGRLERSLFEVCKQDNVKAIAMMGGERFFSTGIHLNVIQSKVDKYQEAWENINKINDVILAMSMIRNKATVAVLQGNAGAGGAMMAAAADIVVSHPGVLLTPTYAAMSLHGSEYWTHFLPQRVGEQTAQKLITGTDPILASTANEIGLVDHVLGEGKRDFQRKLPEFLSVMGENGVFDKIIQEKKKERDDTWFEKLNMHRQYELRRMSENFRSKAFLDSMARFVYKLNEDDEVGRIAYKQSVF